MMPAGKTLRIELPFPGLVHTSSDNWQTAADIRTSDTGLGIHVADLPTTGLAAGRKVLFTLFWPEDNSWEGTDFSVEVAAKATS